MSDGLRQLVEQLAPLAEAVLAAKGDLEKVESVEIAHSKAVEALRAADAEYKSRVDQLMAMKADIEAARVARVDVDEYVRTSAAKAKAEAAEVLAKAKADAQAEADRITLQNQNAIVALGERKVKAEAELKTVQAEIAKFRQEHDQVLAAMNSLSSRLKIA